MIHARTYHLIVLLIVNEGSDQSNSGLRAIQEVKIEGGEAGASSSQDKAFFPEKGFRRNYEYGWRSGGGNGDFPEMIWYRFSAPFTLAEITFRSSWADEAPSKFQIVGSNDSKCNEYSIWYTLYEDLSGKRVFNGKRIRRCVMDKEIKQKFLCYGIKVLDKEKRGNEDAYVMVSNIRMWKSINAN